MNDKSTYSVGLQLAPHVIIPPVDFPVWKENPGSEDSTMPNEIWKSAWDLGNVYSNMLLCEAAHWCTLVC